MPGGALELRPAVDADLPWAVALATGPQVAPFLRPHAVEDLRDAVAAGELLVGAHDGERVAAVRATVVIPRHGIAALRLLMVEPAARGRGLARQLVRSAAARLLADGAHRVEAEAYAYNAAAVAGFAGAGFTREGTRRAAWHRDGAWHDGILFGLVREDVSAP